MSDKTPAQAFAVQPGTASVTVMGEVMIELSPRPDGCFSPGVAGDTFNTAVVLARLGVASDYITALGSDAFSERIRTAVAAQGVGGSHIARVAGASPGLYAIDTDDSGERSFTYWRDRSAARQWFSDAGRFGAALETVPAGSCFYWSGITLALLAPAVRDCLFRFLERYRAGGGLVCFDSNFRASLWADAGAISGAYDEAIGQADLYLPSLDDETAVHGLEDAGEVIALLQDMGVAQVVMTLPGEAVWVTPDQVSRYPLPQSAKVVDTTGAGDAFSGALIAALVRGRAMPEAIQFAHRVAARVVEVPGALLPEPAWTEFQTLLNSESSCQN